MDDRTCWYSQTLLCYIYLRYLDASIPPQENIVDILGWSDELKKRILSTYSASGFCGADIVFFFGFFLAPGIQTYIGCVMKVLSQF